MMGMKKAIDLKCLRFFFLKPLKSMRDLSLEDHTLNDFLILLPFLVGGQLSLAVYEALLASLV